MKIVALFLGLVLGLPLVSCVRDTTKRRDANGRRVAKGKKEKKDSKADDSNEDEMFCGNPSGFYKGIDFEDASMQTLEISCSGEACEDPCSYNLMDTSFSLCAPGGGPGYGFARSADTTNVTMRVYCGGLDGRSGPDDFSFEIDFSWDRLTAVSDSTDGIVIQRRSNGFRYWPVNK